MKVAFVVSDLTYPPVEGLHQQTFLLISGLRDSGVEIALCGFVKSLQNLDSQAMLEDLGIRFATPPLESPGSLLISALKNLAPFSDKSRLMRQVLSSGDYDVIHADGIAACTVLARRDRQNAVLSFVDPGSRRNFRFVRISRDLMPKLKYLVAGWAFYFLERLLRFGGPLWHVVSDSDREYLERTHRYSQVVAIPVSLPANLESLPTSRTGTLENAVSPVVVLVYADLRQMHMRNALKEFTMKVFQRYPNPSDVHYVVLGRVSCDTEMANWFDSLDYEFIPWADDYMDVLRSADLVILPDQFGTGLKNRAIQSMAAGVAVLGTEVAFEGIDLSNGKEAVVVPDADSALESFERLVTDPDLRSRMGAAGRARVVSDFGSRFVINRWLETYEKIHSGDANGTY